MNDLIDLASARETRARFRFSAIEDGSATYADVMAQIRALRRVRGFGSEAWVTSLLRPAYTRLVRKAQTLARSQAIFERDLRTAETCKAS